MELRIDGITQMSQLSAQIADNDGCDNDNDDDDNDEENQETLSTK
jgi:hypothetical protein